METNFEKRILDDFIENSIQKKLIDGWQKRIKIMSTGFQIFTVSLENLETRI